MTATLPIANYHSAANERLFYSREEMAEMFALSPYTIARDCRSGRIQSKKFGRRVLIPRTEVLRFAAEIMGAQQ
jgi:excisionase family DNA binding protein